MLDRIPPELLEQILRDDCITPVDLAVSCRVCKAVLLVAGAELYRSVELLVDEEAVSSDTESEPESDAGDNPVFLLDTTQGPPLDVLKRPHIGILVQEIRLGCIDFTSNAAKSTLNDSLLPPLQPLRVLSLEFITLHPSMFRTLFTPSANSLRALRTPLPLLSALGSLNLFPHLRTLFLDSQSDCTFHFVSHFLSRAESLGTIILHRLNYPLSAPAQWLREASFAEALPPQLEHLVILDCIPRATKVVPVLVQNLPILRAMSVQDSAVGRIKGIPLALQAAEDLR
ncbi:hypothetical protein JCM8547_008344 [Rhodosporidiobolus lusitaniae]